MKLKTHISSILETKAEHLIKVVLIRKGESLANASGLLCGWLDPKLSINGRTQANALMPVLFPSRRVFKSIYSSDLQRCVNFADITLGFNGVIGDKLLKTDARLREINFGDQEGVNYDLLRDNEKKAIDSFEYQAPNGESWTNVKSRFTELISQLDSNGTHCIYTHGGTICSLTYNIGIEDVIPPASVVGLLYNKEDPIASEIMFYWPYDSEQVI